MIDMSLSLKNSSVCYLHLNLYQKKSHKQILLPVLVFRFQYYIAIMYGAHEQKDDH